jgi:hypothetical protein
LLFKPADAPRYAPGFLAVVITSIVSALLALVYRFICVWENRKRDKAGTAEAYEHAYEDDLTDKTVRFVLATLKPLLGFCGRQTCQSLHTGWSYVSVESEHWVVEFGPRPSS